MKTSNLGDPSRPNQEIIEGESRKKTYELEDGTKVILEEDKEYTFYVRDGTIVMGATVLRVKSNFVLVELKGHSLTIYPKGCTKIVPY